MEKGSGRKMVGKEESPKTSGVGIWGPGGKGGKGKHFCRQTLYPFVRNR